MGAEAGEGLVEAVVFFELSTTSFFKSKSAETLVRLAGLVDVMGTGAWAGAGVGGAAARDGGVAAEGRDGAGEGGAAARDGAVGVGGWAGKD